MTCEHLERLLEDGPKSAGELAFMTGIAEAFIRNVAAMCCWQRGTVTCVVERDGAGKRIERYALGDPSALLLVG